MLNVHCSLRNRVPRGGTVKCIGSSLGQGEFLCAMRKFPHDCGKSTRGVGDDIVDSVERGKSQ